MKLSVSAEEAVKVIKSGQRVFIHGAAMTPVELVEALSARASDLRDVEIVHIHTEGPAGYIEPENLTSFRTNSCFIAHNLRKAVNQGRADYIPVFLSDIPRLFRTGGLPIDVALVQLSPPDRHGYCSLGTSVDVALAAIEKAPTIIALINPQVPRSHGEGLIHVSRVDQAVEISRPLFELDKGSPSPVEQAIGRHIAGLVEDGSTLQMGIGGIPNAVLAELIHHSKLGVHTEMFSDGVIDLVERGVVTGECKKVLPRRIVSAFVLGTRKVYDFLHDNPIVEMRDCSFTNDTSVIRQNPKVVAINSAIEVDLTGQVCADTIGYTQFSGVGGQMDFMRGAALSEGGKPIIAFGSLTPRGISKIVPHLKEGAGVTTTRAHVQYVVTEFGVAYLFGKNLRQRARALIDIAHPSVREDLERAAFTRSGESWMS